jgi:beta-N-acetylhexosaminidase
MAIAQPANKSVKLPKPNTAIDKWVDSVYNTLSLDQKIGQLFMIAAYSGGEKYNRAAIEKLITNNGIGGLIFMQGTAEAQVEQTNAFQNMSKVPLLIGMDAEWGLGMRLKNIDDLPRQIMLGACTDTALVYKLGKIVATQCKRMGVHVNFAPVVDVNNNPNNPVINFRSFGENKYAVANYGKEYVKGMQDLRVLACAKHFPGHGNTDMDSHKDLPTISSSAEVLNNQELYPFREMINNQVASIMIAHLQIPALDNTPNMPTTLSKKVVTDLLKEKLNYKGLIITDALNMSGVTKYYQPGEVDAKAFIAGNDVLLFSQDVPTGVRKIKEAMANKTISDARLEESVKKILRAKYFAGLDNVKQLSAINVTKDLNAYTSSFRAQVAANALTLLKSPGQEIIKKVKNKSPRIAVVCVGADESNSFTNTLAASNGTIEKYSIRGNNSALVAKLKSYDAVIVSIHGVALYPGKNFGLNMEAVNAANQILKNGNALGVLFGNPYALKYFCDANSMLVAYDEKPETQKAAANAILGNASCQGRLPVTVCGAYKQGAGVSTGYPEKKNDEIEKEPIGNMENDMRIIPRKSADSTHEHKILSVPSVKDVQAPVSVQCCINPESIGANLESLKKIDVLINNAIAKNAIPGCRILAAKDGKIFYDKSFGYHTYKKTTSVSSSSIYDLASVTKVLSTTLAVMKLYDQNKLDINASLGSVLPMARGTDKAGLKIKDILLHQAGLKSWIPFYKETLDSNKMQRQDIYAYNKKGEYSITVAKDLYMNRHWIDTMWTRILNSPLGSKTYEYSDLDFIFLQKVVEKISGLPLDVYVEKEFYKPLQLKSIGYKPLSNGKSISKIPPTEDDNYFRYQVVQGFVHDMGAAMFGGVAGHAGLFSNADDIAVILQMLLNGGIYEGKRYLNKKTVETFTSYQSTTRRGLGWDKPEPNKNKSNPTADNCSLNTFGHQGFTGTCVWADPVHNIQYIFLSNRTFPSAENKLINSMDLRGKVQEYLYESINIPSIRK